jgi:hypothetical protein
MIALAALSIFTLSGCKQHWVIDTQYAAGEWKIEVQTPPCDSVRNVQVIYPKESGYPITIECDVMPVATK